MFSKIKIKEIVPYVFLFVFLLFVSLITTTFGNDEVWNFGFAKNIYEGLVPYKDFNMIVPPLYPLLMSVPFLFLGTSELAKNFKSKMSTFEISLSWMFNIGKL